MADMSIRELLEIAMPEYTPPPGHRGSMDELGLPPFTLRQINMMLKDSQIKLGKAIKVAPCMHIKKTVSGDPKVAEFANRMMDIAWATIVPEMTNAFWVKVFCGQPTYKKNNGLVELTGCKSYYPADCDFLEINKKLVGIRVKNRGGVSNANASSQEDLYGMKALIYIHQQQYGSRDGVSELEGAFSSWLEKVGGDGAVAKRRMWFHKNAFHGGIIKHPPGSYQWNKSDGSIQEIPYRDIARQAGERAMSGAVWAFPQVFDEKGNSMWEFSPASVNGDGKPMIDYVEQLNTEMLRGMGIPDDIISQTSGTGSYAGRSIPFQAFLTSQNDTIRAMFDAIFRQVVLPLCWWNFQSLDVEFSNIECDRDKLLPPDQPAMPEGGAEDPNAQQVDPNAVPVDPQQAALAAAAARGGQPMMQQAA
jgi:hypothetical protein